MGETMVKQASMAGPSVKRRGTWCRWLGMKWSWPLLTASRSPGPTNQVKASTWPAKAGSSTLAWACSRGSREWTCKCFKSPARSRSATACKRAGGSAMVRPWMMEPPSGTVAVACWGVTNLR